MRGLADPVDGASEDGDLHGLDILLEPLLDLGDHGVHVELKAAAGRAGDENRAALAEVKRLQNLPGDLDLLLRMERGEADADRVPDSVGKESPQSDRRLERAGPLRAGLGD